MALRAGGPVEVRLREEQSPRLAELPDLEAVVFGNEAGEGDGARRGGHILRVVIVLEDDGNPVERAPRATPPPVPIEGVRLLARSRIHVDERVQGRASAVEGFDPLEVLANPLSRAHLTSLHRLLELGDGFLEGAVAGGRR